MRSSGLSVFGVCLLATLAGCTATLRQSGPIAPAPLPQYSLGDEYEFTGGSGGRIVALRPDRIEWRGSDGSFATTRNVLLPPVSWTSPTSSGSRRLGTGEGTLFPLELGESTTFHAMATIHDRAAGGSRVVRETWRCAVDDSGETATPAGRFSVYRVACTMFASDGRQLSRTVYYAPAVGFYVRAETREADGSLTSSALTHYAFGDPALSERARRARDQAVQTALTRDVTGETVHWRDSADASQGTVEPMRTIRSQRYGWCRDYQEWIRARAREYTLIGTACHTSRLGWQLLDVRTYPAAEG